VNAVAGSEIRDSILETIGSTPLVRLSRIGAGVRPQLLAKVEMLNPGGSIKDRIAVAMIDAAERDGHLHPAGTIVEPTSGNTGAALAMAARLRGYRVIAVMPDKVSREKINLLRAYGAEVVVAPTDVAPESPESYYSVAERLAREIPGAFRPNQYANPANADAHYETTGPELWQQTGGAITHLVVGVGTGGTITGTARYLRERKPSIEVIGADPVGSIFTAATPAGVHGYLIEGVGVDPAGSIFTAASPDQVHGYLIEGVGEDFWPQTLDRSVIDRFITVSDRDAFLTTRRLALTEGILGGGSGGMATWAALEVARGLDDSDAVVVVILPDGGRSYLSKIYNDAWMTEYGFIERSGERTVGEVLRRRTAGSDVPPLVTVHTQQLVRDAVALLHEHRVSQLPVVSEHDPEAIVGSVAERGLLAHAVSDPSLLDARIVDVMEPPLPAVGAEDPVSAAVELLVGERQALIVLADGRPAGIVSRADLLEALVR
jgi:cystathionine beta-synthase